MNSYNPIIISKMQEKICNPSKYVTWNIILYNYTNYCCMKKEEKNEEKIYASFRF